MAKRIIKTGIGTYVNADQVTTHALQGTEVDVHKTDLERFDKLNVQPIGAVELTAAIVEDLIEDVVLPVDPNDPTAPTAPVTTGDADEIVEL